MDGRPRDPEARRRSLGGRSREVRDARAGSREEPVWAGTPTRPGLRVPSKEGRRGPFGTSASGRGDAGDPSGPAAAGPWGPRSSTHLDSQAGCLREMGTGPSFASVSGPLWAEPVEAPAGRDAACVSRRPGV